MLHKKYFNYGILSLLFFLLLGNNKLLSQSQGEVEVIDLGTRLEPFVDSFLIESINNLTFEIHHPVLCDTAIIFNSPWEGNLNHYVTVFKDKDIYKMYYRSTPGVVAEPAGKRWELLVCYAESKDGIHFKKPNLGIVEFNGSKNNNIILRDKDVSFSKSAYQNFTPFVDNNPDVNISERYKATGRSSGGLYAFISSDGINWKKKSNVPIISDQVRPKPNNLFDSQNVSFWDSNQSQYVLFVRDMYRHPDTGSRIRGIRRSVSKDFVTWSDPVWLSYSNEINDEFYTNSISPYFRAPHIYFGFPMRYFSSRDAELNQDYNEFRGRGMSDAVFMSSRDGEYWDRNFPTAFISPGLDPLNWTDRSNAVALGLVPIDSNYMSIYVLQHFRLPSIHVRTGKIRLDGISSISASFEKGEFTTKPFHFKGNKLILNYSTSAAGRVRVEIQDVLGNPIDGFALKDSKIFFGDNVNEVISWDGKRQLNELNEMPIRIRFEMKEAKLYSMKFSD